MPYPAPDVAQLVPKHGLKDCVVAALTAYLGKPYEEVVDAAARVRKGFWKAGLEWQDAVKIARRLQIRVRLVRDYDLDEDAGVLAINYNVGHAEHVVLLLGGRILELEDTPVTSWEPKAYLVAHNARPGLLLVRRT